MADIFEITGRIHSTSQEHVISPADEILDTSQNKKQHLINDDVARHESEINSPTNGLNKRVADIEALGQIGDTPVETNASNIISNTSLNGKVPSASAVNGVYNAVVANAGYYTCDSEASTAAKVVDASGYVLTVGGCIKIKMTNPNSANDATLNINSTGAKALYYAGERASATNSWEEGETVEVYYDGTNFYANNVAGGSGSGDGAFDVSTKYPTSGVEGGNTYTLEGALAVLNANLSASKKKGGMSIKFVSSIDHKYVQYFCNSMTFTTDTTYWEKINLEKEIDTINHGNIGYEDVNYEQGKKISSDGTISDDENYNLTDWIAVPFNTQILVYRSDGTAEAGVVASYNESKVRINYYNVTGQRTFNTGENIAYIRFDFPVGYDAKVVNQNSTSTIYWQAQSVGQSVNIFGLKDDVTQLEQSVGTLEQSMEAIAPDVESAVQKSNAAIDGVSAINHGNIAYNDSNCEVGKRIDSSGSTYDVEGYSLTEYIEVPANTNVLVYRSDGTVGNGAICIYNSSKTLISFYNCSGQRAFNTGDTIKYIRFDFPTGYNAKAVNQGNVSEIFWEAEIVEDSVNVFDLKRDLGSLESEIITIDQKCDSAVDEIEIINRGSVSYDDSNCEFNKSIADGGVISTTEGYNLTELIAVPANTNLLVYRSDGTATARVICQYDAAKNYIGKKNCTASAIFETGETIAYIRYDFPAGYNARVVNKANTSQVIWQVHIDYNSVNLYNLKELVNNSKDAVDVCQEDVSDFLQEGTWEDKKKNYVEGKKFKTTSGVAYVIDDDTYGISDKIDVTGIQDATLSVYRNSTVNGIMVACDENNDIIKYWNISTYRRITDLPATAKYVLLDFKLEREQGTENPKVCNSDYITIWQREENVERHIDLKDIHANRWNNITLSDNPLDNISVENRGAGIIKSWGFIGDSLSSGYFSTTPGYSRYDYSWPQRMCRMLSVEGVNYSKGGYTAKAWCNSFGEGTEYGYDKNSTTASTPCQSLFPSDPHQAYTIAFGVNDYHVDEIAVGDVDTDIDMSDYHNNADTYAGWMGQIIQRIKVVNPNAIIFVVTTPHDAQLNMFAYNEVVRDLAEKFTNVLVIDLERYSTSFSDGLFKQLYYYGAHLSAIGYEYVAVMMMTYIDWLIRKNPVIFQSPISLPA